MSINKFLNAGYTQKEAQQAHGECISICKMLGNYTLDEVIDEYIGIDKEEKPSCCRKCNK